VTVHPAPGAAAQQRSFGPVVDGPFDGAAYRWGQWHEHDLVPFPAHAEDPVAVALAEVAEFGASGLEDPQAEESEQGDECEVVDVGRVAAGGEHGLELEVAQAEGG
jgi:hypothetical protein